MQPLQTTLTDFQDYIRKPRYSQPSADQLGNQTSIVNRQFLVEYPVILFLLFMAVSLILISKQVTGQDFYKSFWQRYSTSVGSMLIALIALPLAVIIEEIVFRAVLRLTPNRLRNILALALWIPIGYYYHTIKEITNELAVLWLIPVWGIVVYMLGLYLKRPTVFVRIDAFWQANFHWIFYSIACLYAFLKIIDEIYTFKNGQLLLLPVLVLAGLLNGFYFGYIRMKYGFWYAVAVHTLVLVASMAPEAIRIL